MSKRRFACLMLTTAMFIAFNSFSVASANLALDVVADAGPNAPATTSSAPFPVVVNPPPVTIPGVDPAPITLDPPPVGPIDLAPFVGDPAPITYDPPGVGGNNIAQLINDPAPVTVDPPPVGPVNLTPFVGDPSPITADPPPAGGTDLRPIIGAIANGPAPIVIDPPPLCPSALQCNLAPQTIDPAPVGGNNIAPLINDPAPVTIDAPPVGPVSIPNVDPAPQTIDPPGAGPVDLSIIGSVVGPVYLDPQAVVVPGSDPAQIYYNPPPVEVTGVDPGPIYYDPPSVNVIGIDPPPVSVDAPGVPPIFISIPGGQVCVPAINTPSLPPISIGDLPDLPSISIPRLPTLPPIGITQLPDLPPLDGLIGISTAEIIEIGTPSSITTTQGQIPALCVDPSSVGGVMLPGIDPNPVGIDAPGVPGRNVDPAPIDVNLAPIPGQTVDPAAVSYDPAPIAARTVDPAPVALTPPNPCSAVGSMVCNIGRVDPSPVTVDLPATCGGINTSVALSPCTVPGVDAPPLSVDAPHPCSMLGSMVCTVPSANPSPITVSPGIACTIVTCDVGPVATISPPPVCRQTNPGDPGNVDTCYVPRVDLSPVTYDPPNPCVPINVNTSSAALPSAGCGVPRVDLSPITVDAPNPCSLVGSMVCTVPSINPSPITVDPPNPCAPINVNTSSTALPSAGCAIPRVDLSPITVDPPNTCSATGTTTSAEVGALTTCGMIDPAPIATIDPTLQPTIPPLPGPIAVPSIGDIDPGAPCDLVEASDLVIKGCDLAGVPGVWGPGVGVPGVGVPELPGEGATEEPPASGDAGKAQGDPSPNAVTEEDEAYPTDTGGGGSGPPKPSRSRYDLSIDQQEHFKWGCDMGRAVRKGNRPHDSIVVLDFFSPVKFDENTYGASLYTAPDATTTQIRHAAQQYGRGFYQCTEDDRTAHLTLAIGTSNGSSDVTKAHGVAWARMVKNAAEASMEQGWGKQVTMAGASDIETGFTAGPGAVKDWVDGYSSVNGTGRMWNYGDAGGCPPAGSCLGGWSQHDLYYVSWKSPRSYPLPEIYNEAGTQGKQWQQIEVHAHSHDDDNMIFYAVMTQWKACEQKGGCSGIKNTPAQGWRNLRNELNSSHISEQPDPKWVTDIAWNPGD